MVIHMTSRVSPFVGGLSRLSSKEARLLMIIGVMDISRLMVYVHKVDEENLRDRKDFRNKKANAKGTYFIIF